MARSQTGTPYHLTPHNRRENTMNAMSAGFKPRRAKTSGPASDCVVTLVDGTVYVIESAKSKRKAARIAREVIASQRPTPTGQQSRESAKLDLLKSCGYIGDSNH